MAGLGVLAAWVSAMAGSAFSRPAVLLEALLPYRGRVVMLAGIVPFIPLDSVLGAAATVSGRSAEADSLFASGLALADRLEARIHLKNNWAFAAEKTADARQSLQTFAFVRK